jgi:hypothetical protein
MQKRPTRMAKLITPSKYHRTLDGLELLKRREKCGHTQESVGAALATILGRDGISRVYICQLEHPGEHEIPTDVAEALIKLFGN